MQFETEAEVDEAVRENQGTEIAGRAIMVDYCGNKSQSNPNKGGQTPSRGGDSGGGSRGGVLSISDETLVH